MTHVDPPATADGTGAGQPAAPARPPSEGAALFTGDHLRYKEHLHPVLDGVPKEKR
jgi:hypothetical protein